MTFKTRIDNRLRELFDGAIARAETIDPAYAGLLTVTRDQLLRSGKRLRPYLTELAYRGCGGRSADIITAAAGQELIHHFLLIHDDVIDRDLVRHGGPNVAGVYYAELRERGLPDDQAYHYAASYAILAGNACCALSLQAILDSRFQPARKLQAVGAIQRMMFDVMGGQLTDVSVAIPGAATASLEQLLRICRYKTASYSFEAPLRVGAALAGAGPAKERALVAFARSLGVAFQLADDLLGVYGNEATLGKPILSDLHEGKQTVLIHYALAAATPAQARQLLGIWGHRAGGPADLEVARGLIRDTGAQVKVRALAESHLADALAALQSAGLSKRVQAELVELAHFCVQRTY